MKATETTEAITAATIANKDNAYKVVDLAATMAPGVLEIREMAPTRFFLDLMTYEPGTCLTIEIGLGTWDGKKSKYSLPWRWYRDGYTSKLCKTWWTINTYYRKANGDCVGYFNPCEYFSTNKGRMCVDFTYYGEADAWNLAAIITEIMRRQSKGIAVRHDF